MHDRRTDRLPCRPWFMAQAGKWKIGRQPKFEGTKARRSLLLATSVRHRDKAQAR